MTDQSQAEFHLVGFDATLAVLDDRAISADGIVASYASIMVPRLRSAYSAMRLLLLDGRHDEMVLLLRRQLEDSMRLHFLVSNPGRAEQLVMGHRRAREMKVLRQLDRSINNTPEQDPARSALKAMATVRRQRIKDLDETVSDLGLTLEDFPAFGDMASELGRAIDLVPYASASEVSHSAVSAATDGYVATERREGREARMISLTSDNVADRISYARVAINTTAMAVTHGLNLLGMDSEARLIGVDGSARVEALAETLTGLRGT